jgi:hypothetical protein
MVQSIHSRVDVTWSIDYVRGTNPVLFSCTTEGDHERLLLKRELPQRRVFYGYEELRHDFSSFFSQRAIHRSSRRRYHRINPHGNLTFSDTNNTGLFDD